MAKQTLSFNIALVAVLGLYMGSILLTEVDAQRCGLYSCVGSQCCAHVAPGFALICMEADSRLPVIGGCSNLCVCGQNYTCVNRVCVQNPTS